ncbi:MAG: DUF4387 family protein [Sphaerochaetaceae bacterium]|nr:DUF4387 family protein [Sphaerochaetaceae bacterium]
MKKLYEYARMIRSKTAGPFMLTLDILFPDGESYNKVINSGAFNVSNIAKLYNVSEENLQRYDLPLAYAVKFTMPRKYAAGDFEMEDLYGCQEHRPMIMLDIPD